MITFRSVHSSHWERPWSRVAIALMLWAAGHELKAQPAAAPTNAYAPKILVANRSGFEAGALIDPHLLNPWGIALRPPGAGGHFWISNAGNASTSTYLGDAHG